MPWTVSVPYRRHVATAERRPEAATLLPGRGRFGRPATPKVNVLRTHRRVAEAGEPSLAEAIVNGVYAGVRPALDRALRLAETAEPKRVPATRRQAHGRRGLHAAVKANACRIPRRAAGTGELNRAVATASGRRRARARSAPVLRANHAEIVERKLAYATATRGHGRHGPSAPAKESVVRLRRSPVAARVDPKVAATLATGAPAVVAAQRAKAARAPVPRREHATPAYGQLGRPAQVDRTRQPIRIIVGPVACPAEVRGPSVPLDHVFSVPTAMTVQEPSRAAISTRTRASAAGRAKTIFSKILVSTSASMHGEICNSANLVSPLRTPTIAQSRVRCTETIRLKIRAVLRISASS
jgi:hypothetical protein